MGIKITKNTFKKYRGVVGVDEVGRGSLAGPVFAGAFFVSNIDEYEYLKEIGVKDSKKLSEKRREEFYGIFEKRSIFSTSFLETEVIDKINIRQASLLAMSNAVKKLEKENFLLLIDGRDSLPLLNHKQYSIIRGDDKYLTISAASIVAKVERDRLMVQLAKKHKKYFFDKNKGYGTKEHIKAIRKFGSCAVHRKSFIIKGI